MSKRITKSIIWAFICSLLSFLVITYILGPAPSNGSTKLFGFNVITNHADLHNPNAFIISINPIIPITLFIIYFVIFFGISVILSKSK